MNLNLTQEQEKKLYKRLKDKKITLDDFISNLIIRELESVYLLKNGYYYDFYVDKLFDKKGNPILLSKTQSNIVKTLILEAQGDNIPVSVEMIWLHLFIQRIFRDSLVKISI